jgi:hypothetical protein
MLNAIGNAFRRIRNQDTHVISAPVLVERRRADLTQLETLPRAVRGIIFGFLSHKDKLSLSRTSHAMRQSWKENLLAEHRRARGLKPELFALLRCPPHTRTLLQLTGSGLLQKNAADILLSDQHLEILRSDRVIKGLFLNCLAGVEVDVLLFSRIPVEQLHTFARGKLDLLSDQHTNHHQGATPTRDDRRATQFAESIIKSRIFSNVLDENKWSLFSCYLACLDSHQGAGGPHIVKLMSEWAKTLNISVVNGSACPHVVVNSRTYPYIYAKGRRKTLLPPLLAFRVVNGPPIIFEALVARGLKVNALDHKGRTPLFFVRPVRGATKYVARLIELGIRSNQTDHKGNTALLRAVQRNHTDIVMALLRHGVDVNIRNPQGKSALHLMLENHIFCISQARAFIDAGINLFAKDGSGKAAITYLEPYMQPGVPDSLNVKDARALYWFLSGAMNAEKPGSVSLNWAAESSKRNIKRRVRYTS